jgi:N-acetylglutamate synthase-like GNAT family acetyltransferase
MIRLCVNADTPAIEAIINEAAMAYKGVIPVDCWHEPYMPHAELLTEIASGVKFWGCEEDGVLLGVMGLQDVSDVTLIRHAYVRPSYQARGLGAVLLKFLESQSDKPVLIGTWADAHWAIRFYERHGFRLVDSKEKDGLLRKYWSISDRQREASVVLHR